MKLINQWVAVIFTASMISIAVFAHAGEQKNSGATDCRHDRDVNFGGKESGSKHSYKKIMRPALAEFLDLTEAQTRIIESAHSAQEPSFKTLRVKLRAAHRALDEAGETNADDATLNQLSSELASIIAQQNVAHIKMRRLLISVLTPEQQKKLSIFEAEHSRKGNWHNQRQAPQS